MKRRLDRVVTQVQEFLLNRVDVIRIDALGRQHRTAAILLDTNQHVTAAEIVEIVREGTERLQHALRIPARLVFDALAFHRALAQQISQIDRQLARHRVTPLDVHSYGRRPGYQTPPAPVVQP